MSYTPTIWENGKAPAINADNLNKIENELVRLGNVVGGDYALASEAGYSIDASVNDEYVLTLSLKNKDEVTLSSKSIDLPIESEIEEAKNTITSTTSTTMPNSYDGRLKIEEIVGGESEQITTAGNQLLDISVLSVKASNGITFLPQADGGIKVSGTSTAQVDYYLIGSNSTTASVDGAVNGTCYIKLKEKPAKCYIRYIHPTDSSLAVDVKDNTSITYEDSCKIILRVPTGTTVDETVYVMFSNTDAPWEMYSGGYPSPSPNAPQEIKKTVVSGIKTHGKNFYHEGNVVSIVKRISNTTITCNENNVVINKTNTNMQERLGITLLAELDGKFTVSAEMANLSSVGLLVSNTIPEAVSTSNDKTVEVKRGQYLTIVGVISQDFSGDATMSNIQIEYGEVATDYEPYTESVATLPQPIELYGMGDVKDILTTKQTKRKYVKRVFEGSEEWLASSSFVGRYYINNIGCKAYGNVLCSHARGNVGTEIINSCYLREQDNGRFVINTEFSDLDEWKAHLAENPMTVVCELAEETTEELPIADQIALNSIKTFDGITYLEFDAEIKPTFEGEYGTSKVGGMTLESLLTAQNNDLRLSSLEASVVNNI